MEHSSEPDALEHQQHMHHAKDKHHGLKEAAFYTAAGVAGLGHAVNELHHSFHNDAKEFPEIVPHRTERKADWDSFFKEKPKATFL